jgi:hypothetical protein
MAGKRSGDVGVPERRDLSIGGANVWQTGQRLPAPASMVTAAVPTVEPNVRQVIAIGERQMDLDRKLKTALDESRLLILGAQVLFGFMFQAVFQDLFNEVPAASQAVQCAGLGFMLLSVCFLIAPSLFHQIVFGGESHPGALAYASWFAGASLLPLTLGLGASVFVVFEHLFGRTAGAIFGGTFTVGSLLLLYGLGLALRRPAGRKQLPDHTATPLKTKIEQMLTEARVIIPGGQALLGFQFVCTFTRSFKELPLSIQYLHAAGLCAVALSVLLLMTPAALHRIGFHGEDDAGFFKIGSVLVVASAVPLASGIACDVAVVFFKVTESMEAAAAAGAAALIALIGVWLGYPVWRRSSSAATR